MINSLWIALRHAAKDQMVKRILARLVGFLTYCKTEIAPISGGQMPSGIKDVALVFQTGFR